LEEKTIEIRFKDLWEIWDRLERLREEILDIKSIIFLYLDTAEIINHDKNKAKLLKHLENI